MAIISERPKFKRYSRTQYRYAMIYVAVTFAALLFLNLYCSATCKKIFYQSKESAMLGKTQLAASEISKLEVLTPSAVTSAVNSFSNLKYSRMIITDQAGQLLYDSAPTDANTEFDRSTQISKALECYDVFTWYYHDGVMRSEAAVPVVSYGVTVGCVYMLELDNEQGVLMKSLQMAILTITIALELLVISFSIAFSRTFSKRLEKIMNSMRIIEEGDYTHRVEMGGHDELTVLGDEFNDLTERLAISENKRRQFVSDASHELKTPLASIKLLSDSILQNDMDMETVREFVGDIGDEADRLTRMSQKLLDLTRGEAQEPDVAEIIYMAPSVERVLRMLSTQAQQSGVEIITDLDRDTPVLIREDDLYRIIFNLVENGIKYNVPGGKVTVSLERTEECGILRVSDTGSGIPEDAISHIYERFYRVDKARSRASGGSGLGLSIVRNMVERNNGTITVQSVLGEGTSFTVEFTAFDTEDTERSSL